ncbi:bifunctional biotin--[acetyl-CoA-carboxylase] ligase/biotin operon repressor BirA [Shewanella surugensis]|uniref:Bifunctional ligase/repressor BirA n=1 Tax=Shewanella surugensis TaxID=212020 RepID=A0ABT0LF46_9GAMM|nr:bifunctional biotin--[acetyl-CoA-carboxylase] ligase/biotin operon repressor BirA [Shewanella surugensis]MCL1125781.1 bifunctional biotin--[acetyl-CoA-carboxylase] ligase/biotin operon repressor BirA [Shewanella surugensis]
MIDHWARKRQILMALADENFVSGEILAQLLGISRTAIANHISALEEYGVDIYSVKGKGYKLVNLVYLVDEEKLTAATHNRCFYFNELGSTNAFLLKHMDELKSGDICVSEYQSAGRGRRGRTWFSPYGCHLYTSIFWSFPQGMAQAMGLSLVVACSLVKVLEAFGVSGLGVKWPNDIYLNHKKLAGVLVEMSGQTDSECNVVIGIGINMAMPNAQGDAIGQPWSDLSELEHKPSKTDLVIALQKQLFTDLRLFEAQGLVAFMVRWQAADLFLNQAVILSMASNHVSGICKGIDDKGAILLETTQGLEAYVGGEISLRSAS